MVLCSAPKFGPHPGGSYGGQGGLSFYVGAKGRQWSQISHRRLKISISGDVVILATEPNAMLSKIAENFNHSCQIAFQNQPKFQPLFRKISSPHTATLITSVSSYPQKSATSILDLFSVANSYHRRFASAHLISYNKYNKTSLPLKSRQHVLLVDILLKLQLQIEKSGF